MTINIDTDQRCWHASPQGPEHSPAARLDIITDDVSRMSMALMNGLRIAITEDVAGAKDGKKHPKAGDSDSLI